MKNLTSRLTLEAVVKLQRLSNTFPAGVNSLRESFDSKTSFLDMTYDDLLFLKSHNVIEGLDVTDVEKIFTS